MRTKAISATAAVTAFVVLLAVIGVVGATASASKPVPLASATHALMLMSGRQQVRSAVAEASSSDPSGVTAPHGNLPGWRQIYLNQFQAPARTGSFGNCRWANTLTKTYCPALPRTDRRSLAAYDDWIIDTQKTGRYMASKVLSIHNGYLDYYLHDVDGVPAGAVVAPKIPSADGTGQTYGAYAVRFRADALSGYHLVIMLWADGYARGERWPAGGEFDFPEGDLNQSIGGYFHYVGTQGPTQYAFSRLGRFSTWHTAVIEWTPHVVHYIMDGRVVASITKHIPHKPMHLLLQAETGSPTYTPPASVNGHIQVAWVAAYARSH